VNTTPPMLAFEGIGKRFGDVVALDDASLTIRPGTVHALLGENGAGKTTLMRIAYGMVSPDRGVLRIDGQPVRLSAPADAIARGVGMVHQHFTLVPAMTVAENIALGGHGRFDARNAAEHISALAQSTGLSIDPGARVGDLSITAQQRLELLKALSRDARVLILDEPTAVLAPAEADDLLRRIRELANAGRAVVLITHKLREALSVADDITVLRRGATILTRPRAQVDEELLIEAMLGAREFQPPTAPRAPVSGAPVVDARDISVADRTGTLRVRNATFQVRAGEIVGVAAVEGSGHRELLRAVARRALIASGQLHGPETVGFVPDDRHRDGLIAEISLAENYALKGAGVRRGRLPWSDFRRATLEIIERFDVRAGSERSSAQTLSGGNQQKFILGRELYGLPPALVIENPSRGLDIRASTYVRSQVLSARSHGVAIMLYSTDLDEVLAVADRMLVVYAGSVREVSSDPGLVGRAMLGAA
jgi:general nucleoside transport system ATP-binding protein